jgi:predicted PurR-regulated permease PerM
LGKQGLHRNYFYLLLLFAIYVAYVLFRPYLGVIVFAVVTVIIFRPVYLLFLRWFKGNHTIAFLVLLLAIFIVILVPLFLVIETTVGQILELSQQISNLDLANLSSNQLPFVPELTSEISKLSVRFPILKSVNISEEQVINTVQAVLSSAGTFMAKSLVEVGTSSVDWITKVIIYLSLLGALFPGWPHAMNVFKDISPLEDQLDQQYVDRIVLMTQAMVRGTFVLVILQGLVMGLFLWIAGVPYVFFWMLLTAVFSLLPGGAGFIAFPASIYLLASGNIWQGLAVLLGYIVVVANIDPVVRPRLVPRETRFNPALVLLSLAGGIKLFGILGAIYGPVILVFLITTVEIYLQYYNLSSPPAQLTET